MPLNWRIVEVLSSNVEESWVFADGTDRIDLCEEICVGVYVEGDHYLDRVGLGWVNLLDVASSLIG